MRKEDDTFIVGELVEKTKGYKFPGVIRSIFWTLSGELRYVVEADDPDFAGMLHIFNKDQLRLRREG